VRSLSDAKKKRKKISALALTRRLIQAAAFILFPGLFISTFSAIKSIYVSIIGGTFSVSAQAGQIVLAVSMLVVTAIMGRFFCGFLCAFGTMGDFFWFVGGKLNLRRPKISGRADRMLKGLKYVLLVGIIVLVWTFGFSILSGTQNPWTVFGMYATYKGWSDLSALVSVGAALLLLIILGSVYIERFFCRYLCPLGAIFAVVSKFRLFRIRKPGAYCGACRACTKKCSMGIPLYHVDVVTSSECIDCMNCVNVCPRDNVTANPKPALAAAVAVVAMSGMHLVGNLANSVAAESSETSFVAETMGSTESDASGQYIDGVYSGSASGYHGMTSVQVTVENGYITAVEVLSTGDDMEFFNRAKCCVIPDILSEQSVDVDTVSGATFSSDAILGAVSNALQSALSISSDVTIIATDETDATATPVLTPAPTPEAIASPEGTETPADSGTLDLADGTYTGTGTGFRGDIEVTVTVENGSITAITINAYRDDEQYFSRAKNTVIDKIISEQTPDVDAVSGATYSSNGIMEAVADALNVEYTATTPSGGQQNRKGHH
jgi:uncharacterized protein with FMN-binding domain